MAEIFPFAAYRYNTGKVDLARVLTQPYDKITPEMQERYYALSPHNLVAVEKGRALPGDDDAHNVYTRAAEKLDEWIASGILVRDSVPAVYAYFQDYALPGTSQRRTRKGFIALGRVCDYEDGVVFRHEQTLAGPKADRLELLRRTRAYTGQLFMLYSDPARRIDALIEQVARVPAPVELTDEFGVVHRLWPVGEPEVIERFRTEMLDKPLVIADGHHRYETALAYRNECRAALGASPPNAPHESTMMTFINTHSEGLTILPTHRVVSGLAGFELSALRKKLETVFDWYTYPFHSAAEREVSLADFQRDLARRGRTRHSIGAYAGDGAFYLFVLRPGVDLKALLPGVSPAQHHLDVVLLHRLLLEQALGITADAVVKEKNISYEREMERAIATVDGDEAQLCFLLNPVRVKQVVEIALGGEVLPQKSTDFYPKLLSGLTIYKLEE